MPCRRMKKTRAPRAVPATSPSRSIRARFRGSCADSWNAEGVRARGAENRPSTQFRRCQANDCRAVVRADERSLNARDPLVSSTFPNKQCPVASMGGFFGDARRGRGRYFLRAVRTREPLVYAIVYATLRKSSAFHLIRTVTSAKVKVPSVHSVARGSETR